MVSFGGQRSFRKMGIGKRVGRFLFFVGIIVLMVFLVTDQLKNPDYRYFCCGVLLLGLGGYAIWRSRSSPTRTNRFGLFRKKQNTDDQGKQKEL